ncbi:MAG: DUF1801 domain-containing protein [Bryobacteraceae bacterium]
MRTGKAAPKNTDEYLAGVPEPARSTLSKIRATIRSVVPPEATEAIIYGMPAFRYRGALVCYAAFSDHCSFFPMSAALIEEFKDDVKNYQTAKGTIRFALDKPLPAGLLKKFVKARIAQNEAKQKKG